MSRHCPGETGRADSQATGSPEPLQKQPTELKSLLENSAYELSPKGKAEVAQGASPRQG